MTTRNMRRELVEWLSPLMCALHDPIGARVELDRKLDALLAQPSVAPCAVHPQGCGPYQFGLSWAENHVTDAMRMDSDAVMFAAAAFEAGRASLPAPGDRDVSLLLDIGKWIETTFQLSSRPKIRARSAETIYAEIVRRIAELRP